MTVVSDYTAILQINDTTAARWNATTDLGVPVIVTYSFADGGNVPTVSESSYFVSSTSAFTELQRANFRDVADIYQSTAGIVFVEVEEGGMIDISNANGSSYGGWASYPWVSEYSTSSGIFVVDSFGDYQEGSYGFQIMLHELGHAMGLQHTHDGSLTLSSGMDNQYQTVMTYNNTSPYTSVLGLLDVQALQHLYGAAVDTSAWDIHYDSYNDTMVIAGSSKADSLLGVAGSNRIIGGSGGDTVIGRDEVDRLYGGRGNDGLFGGYDADDLFGGGGRDDLFGGSSNDRLKGGGGADHLYGGLGSDELFGAAGNDRIYGEDYSDDIFGGLGDDSLFGGTGNDELSGQNGKDMIFGGLGWDSLFGGGGKDKLYGTEEDGSSDSATRYFYGGGGNDRLFGGAGNDQFYGGAGKDTITGGSGRDVFYFSEDGGADRFKDFEDGYDHISLADVDFTFDDLKFVSKAQGDSTLIKVAGYDVSLFLKDISVDQLSYYDFYS